MEYINEGKIKAATGWKKDPQCRRGWDVVTNDNGWGAGTHVRHSLDTQAWGHAKNYDVARVRDDGQAVPSATDVATSLAVLESAAQKGPVLTDADIRFITHVNRLTPPHGLTTGPVLRVEVTHSTDLLARLTPRLQCRILERWANAQDVRDEERRFASLFPFYNHGDAGMGTLPYDSFAMGTFPTQLALIADPKPGHRSSGQTPGGAAREPVVSAAPTSPPVTPPAARAPDVMSFEPSNVVCDDARLNGWVNPHGSPTTYYFEYWKRGEPAATRPSGSGDVGAALGACLSHVSSRAFSAIPATPVG